MSTYRKKRQKLGIFVWVTCGILWASIQLCTLDSIALRRTAVDLTRFQEVIQQFKDKKGELPRSVTELYGFCTRNQLSCSFYDAFGNPFQYLRLGKEYYIVRSFGEKGEENNATYGRNLVRGKLPPLPAISVKAQPNRESQLAVFPAHFNDGIINQDGSWFARLYRDHRQRLSLLILENKVNSDLFMVAREQKIEEFYWVSSTQIAYTQSGAYRSPDDIYLWDLSTGQTRRLIACSTSNQAAPFFNQTTKMMFSILGMNTSTQSLYVLARSRDFEPLSPGELYNQKNIFEINVNTATNEFCQWKKVDQAKVNVFRKKSFALSGSQAQRDYILSFDEKGVFRDAPVKKMVESTLEKGCRSMSGHYLYEVLLQQLERGQDYNTTLKALALCGSLPTYMHSITDKLRK